MTPPAPRTPVIPLAATISAVILGIVSFLGLCLVFLRGPDRGPNQLFPFFPLFPLMIFVPLLIAAYVLLAGYVYGDARRRGMRYVMWTLLAIFVPNGIGIILYFILRDPMPVYCSRCGNRMQAGFAYCPGCGANFLPACRSCGKTLQTGWTHCAWCGART